MPHKCPVQDCTRNCNDAYLMCRNDWFRVTRATQNSVYEAFAGGSGMFSKEYAEAREKAIAEAEASRLRKA